MVKLTSPPVGAAGAGPSVEGLDGLRAKVDLTDHEQVPLLDGVPHREEAGHEARLVGRFVERPRVQPACARLARQRQIPRLHLLEGGGINNQDLRSEDVEHLPIG